MKQIHGVQIDEQAMETCYFACEQTLYEVVGRQQPDLREQLVRFMRIDLNSYLKIACLGFIITVIAWLTLPQEAVLIIAVYFSMLASLAIFECYKMRYYQTTELMVPVYLHPARVFLLKSAAIALCQLVLFVVFLFMAWLLQTSILKELLLYCLVPLYTYQLLLLLFLHHIRHTIGAMVCYLSVYGGYLFFVELFQLQSLLTLSQLLILFAGILVVYGVVEVSKVISMKDEGGYDHEFNDGACI